MLIAGGFNSWRRVGCAATWLLVASLASCGGGTGQIEPFQAERIVSFGDETSSLDPDGKRYSINAVDANNVLDCAVQPLWTQLLVASFGLVLDRCNPSALPGASGITRGAALAKANDLPAQVTAQLAADPPNNKHLFLVMVGMHDIIERYEAGAACDDDELKARGRVVAAQVNRLVAAGGRVIVSTVHDIGLTPYARAKEAVSAGQMALLTCLTATFNARVRVEILQDGRFIGLVLADDVTQLAVKSPPSVSAALANVTDAACTATAALPNCTSLTLVSGATGASHLWADDRHFGPTMHVRLGTLADNRARNNPF